MEKAVETSDPLAAHDKSNAPSQSRPHVVRSDAERVKRHEEL
jgi:hypothetical protein